MLLSIHCHSLQRGALPQFTKPSRRISAHRCQTITRAEAGGGLGGFFKKDGSKEDAAKKALQEAFQGKKDPFAIEEERRRKQGGGGDGGSGGGGGGGGGGGFGGFNFSDWGDNFKKWVQSTLRTLAAVVMFASAISLFYLWKPVSAFVVMLVRKILRLDANPRAQLAGSQNVATPDFNKKEGLGNVEEAVIGKWAGGDEDEETDGSEYDEEEEDEE